MESRIKGTKQLKNKFKSKLAKRYKFSKFIELPETKFSELVREVESDSLFKELAWGKRGGIVSFRRFHQTDLAKSFCELKEEIISGSGFDNTSFLENREEIIRVIENIGIEKFKKHFLYNEKKTSLESIADECGIGVSAANEIIKFVNDYSICSETCSLPSVNSYSGTDRYNKIAVISRVKSGTKNDFIVNFTSPHMARGRYIVNYKKLEDIKSKGKLSDSDIKRLNRLIGKMELINARKSVLFQIIEGIINNQLSYFNSGDPEDLVPLNQREMALRIGIDPSIVCRAIMGRCIETPAGEVHPISYFFKVKRENYKRLINKILKSEKYPLSDEEISEKLRNNFALKISRRSVSTYRSELKIPSSFKRH
ncbi:MAG: hypothetical protein JW983_07960 [Elusimicrobia bacterium]|nr:hypothetical protein [Elusimicrobiota bacterium]